MNETPTPTTATAEEREDHAAPVHRHLGLALAVISAAQLMVVLDATIVNVALPSIQRDLGFSPTGLEWIINGYALAFGGLLLLGGRTGDLYGRRRMFEIGVLLFAAASFAGGFATNQTWLILCRVVQGVGGAIASPTALALITSTFPEGQSRNRAMGVYAAMSGAGAAVGLLLGGVLTDLLSWRWVFFVNVPIGALVALASPRILGETDTREGGLDLPGALSVTGGMTLLVYGLSHAAGHGWSNRVTLGSIAAAVVLLAVFVAVETRSRHALMPLHIFGNRNRSGAFAIMLTTGAALFAMFFFITQFIQDILGYSPLRAGLAFLPVAIAIAAIAGVSSQLVGRVGPGPLIAIGPLGLGAGLLWPSHISISSIYLSILGPLLLIAGCLGLTFVPLTLTALAAVRRDEAGLASALLNTAQQIGGSLGLAILVTVATTVTTNHVRDAMAAAARGGTALPPAVLRATAVTSGYAGAFRVGAAIGLLASVIALVVIRVRRSDAAGQQTAPIAH